jgi:hypothetical protein
MGPKRKAAKLSSMTSADVASHAARQPIDYSAPSSTATANAAFTTTTTAAAAAAEAVPLPPKMNPSHVYQPVPMGVTLTQALNTMITEGSISEAVAKKLLVRGDNNPVPIASQ